MSVFFFQRFGIIVPFILGPCILVVQLAVKLFSSDTRKFEEIPWALPVGFIIGGVVTFVIGTLLENWQKRTEELTADEFYLFEPADVFMFVRVKYWGYIWCVIAVLFYLKLSHVIG
jgi:hypothetical protein